MRLIPDNYNCSPWLGALFIAGVAFAIAVLVGFTDRVQFASENSAEQQIHSAADQASPTGRYQIQMK
jgi:uncharacterized membrane protein YciS (DUF1049 family)